MIYLLISPIHSVSLLEKQIISWFIKIKTCFLNEYFWLLKKRSQDAFSLSGRQEEGGGGSDFCINEKLKKRGRVRHLNLGFKYE